MKINEKLMMTVPLYRDDQVYAWVHAAPIGRDVFKANYQILAKCFDRVMELGRVGPRMTLEVLNDAAREVAGVGGDADGVSRALMNEIRRLSNVVVQDGTRWDYLPLEDALSQKSVDEEDAEEVLCAIVFFTVVWLTAPKNRRIFLMDHTCGLWGAAMSSLTLTAFIDSLRTSTATVNSGETKQITTMTAADGETQTVSLPV